MGKKIQFIGRYALEGHLLGKGSFARVELAHHSVTGCKVAIKIIDTRKLKEEYQKSNIQREARIMGQLRHPNIVRLYETLKATTLHCLVLEYASGGELQAFIKLQKDFRLSEDRGRPYIRQLVSALHYLHERGVAHRDLKMENIMLDTPKINVKLVDFGLSNTFSKDELMKTHCGSPEYAAPELFTAGGKYGLEIDIWSLGIVMYALLVGKLPFTTPYTDQYRRQKLVQQMEKGLTDMHNQEMNHLTIDCQDLLHKVIEPSPSLRLPLLDMEIHPWFTENAKKPFFPFQSFPRDRVMKTQMQDSMSSLEEEETYEELATALGMRREMLEQKVAENKSDELSAMFNMILDRKRQQQGYFDVDHTIKSAEKKESKGKRSKHDKKHKGPPELILPSDEPTAESGPHSGNEPDHETKFSSFDFLALCSTPNWLGGPERRKSRRRSRSPMPSSVQHGAQGLSLRNQMKRDYLERQAIDMERDMIREEKAATASLLVPNPESPQQPCDPSYNDHHVPVSTSLSVPRGDSASSYQNAFRRSSSFKLSRRRALSCGPSQKHTSSFQRSGSVDHRGLDVANAAKDARSPSISGEASLQRGSAKTVSLKVKRSSSIGRNSMAALRKQSMDFMDSISKNFLGVPSHEVNHKTLLGVPGLGSNNSLSKVPEVELNNHNHLQIPNLDADNQLLCVSNHTQSAEDAPESPSGSRSITRPGKLPVKECYIPPTENSKPSSKFLPLIKPPILGANGPLTQAEVHCGDNLNTNFSAELLQPSSYVFQKKASDLLSGDLDKLTATHRPNKKASDLLPGDLERQTATHRPNKKASDLLSGDLERQTATHRPNPFSLDGTDKLRLGDVMSPKRHTNLSLTESAATSFPLHSRPTSKSSPSNNNQLEVGAVAMQIEDKSKSLCTSSENHKLLNVEVLSLAAYECSADLDHHFNELILSSECLEENEDHVDSMTELISDSFRNEVLANAKPSLTSPADICDGQKINKHGSSNTPDDDHLITKNSSSLASFSKSSSSTRKSSSGKVKSPTTPTWLSLRTPLARVESFHSDDFECFVDSDNDEQCSASSASANTPTLSCFAYKLQALTNKQTKVKYNSNAKQSGCGCGSNQNSDYLSSKLNRNTMDKKHSSVASGHTRQDAAVTDPLLSSGSETEHHDDGQERFGAHGKSKIHPMGKDERDAELMSKSDTKYLSYHNAVTRQPNQINNAFSKTAPEIEQGTKKKAFVKHLAWRKSFAQFLKRKRYHSPLVTSAPQQHQQIHHNHRQQPSLGHNNNNDLAPMDSLTESRNGISALSQLQTKTIDISGGTEDMLVGSQDGDRFKIAASTLSQVPMENIVTELIELQSSPKVHIPPSPNRVFDFNLTTDSPKMKSSCLLGWGTCQNCGREDVSSEEDNDYFTAADPTVVTLNIKSLGENNVSGNMNCSQLYKT